MGSKSVAWPGSLVGVLGAMPSRAAPRVVLGILLLLATSNKPLGKVAGLTFRLDLAGGALAVGVVLVALARRRPIPVTPALLGLGGFVAFQVISSVANRAVWPQGVKFSLFYVLGLASVLAVLVLVRDTETARWALSLIVTLAVAETMLSVLIAVGSSLLSSPLPEPMLHTLAYRARGAMSEPNLFGSLLLVPFAVALWRWTGPPHVAKGPGAAALALSAGLVFAATRAAWVAALAVAWLSPLRRRMRGRQLRQLILGAAAAAGLLLASDLVLRQGSLRVTSLYDRLVPGEGTGFDGPLDFRLAELRAGLSSWRESPWSGHGAGSGKMLTQYAHYRQWTFVRTEPWISNGILFVLHDSGLVGLALFVLTVGAVGRQWWRARARMGEPKARIDHDALGAGLAAVLLAWQATHGLWQMYGYLYLGLLLAMSRLAEQDSVSPDARPLGLTSSPRH